MSSTVLIVGAGPTGLTLACSLARQGVGVRVIEKSPGFQTGSRGKGLNPRSLEVLADFGITERLLGAGREREVFRKYFDGEFITDTDPHEDIRRTPDVPYPRGLFLPQTRVEQALREVLAGYGVEVELGCELAGFDQDETRVTARLASGEEILADYLVGCDGGRSTVRKRLGIAFEGSGDRETAMVVGDVELEGLEPGYWHQWFSAKGALLLYPFESTTTWQFQANPERDADGRPVEPSPEGFQRIIEQHTGRTDVRVVGTSWISTWRVNVRLAERYRVGRVLLAGDAAHVHPIAGGLGMNTGIQDGWNLGWKLGYVLTGQAGPGLIDSYPEERRPVAARTLDITTAAMTTVAERSRTPGVGLEVVRSDDTTGLNVGYRWSSLATDGLDGVLQAGDRAPDAPLTDGEGRIVRLFELFAGSHFTLLAFGCPAPRLDGPVRGFAVDAGEDPLYDKDGHARRAYGIEGPALVLVRPDNHIALTAGSDGEEAVRGYLRRLRGL
ncbi:FAD-dependent monooxygenase [Kitasatospora sp. NPDC001175]|uniref:FAD-dependent monooxygenase n=1 Tax=Kitasatospora sp. NPDC001175 TaxID=3157103 RepID=UPI003D03D077